MTSIFMAESLAPRSVPSTQTKNDKSWKIKQGNVEKYGIKRHEGKIIGRKVKK